MGPRPTQGVVPDVTARTDVVADDLTVDFGDPAEGWEPTVARTQLVHEARFDWFSVTLGERGSLDCPRYWLVGWSLSSDDHAGRR